jgi:hypothetical protein
MPETKIENVLRAEFSDAVPLARFHRYWINTDDGNVTLFFGLLGEDGINRHFRCPVGVAINLSAEFGLLTMQADNIAKQIICKQLLIYHL